MAQLAEFCSSRLGAVLFLSLLLGLFAACSGTTQSQLGLADPPDRATRATLAGPLCTPETCQCREDGGDPEQKVPEGFKRFEVRVGPAEHELWATVDKMVFYKSSEKAMDCFYLDLRPGEHPVRLRAQREEGLSAKLTIRELAPRNEGWYETFEFSCGSPGVCQHSDLDRFKTRLGKVKRNLHDPCGSTKIKKVNWQTGRLPDNLPPGDLQLDLTMQIYEFTPNYAPGDAACVNK